MTKNSYTPESTDPKDVMAARTQAERTRRAKLAFDDELIRRMDEGPMIDASDVDWDQMRKKAIRIAASQGGRR